MYSIYPSIFGYVEVSTMFFRYGRTGLPGINVSLLKDTRQFEQMCLAQGHNAVRAGEARTALCP